MTGIPFVITFAIKAALHARRFTDEVPELVPDAFEGGQS